MSTLDQWEAEANQSKFSLERLNMKRHWDPDTYDILKLKNKRILALIELVMKKDDLLCLIARGPERDFEKGIFLINDFHPEEIAKEALALTEKLK